MERLIALLLAVLLLCGCTASASYRKETFLAMDTVMTLQYYGAAIHGEALVETLEKKLSVTDPASEIGMLNSKGQGSVSPETAALLETALTLCARTEGALDITVYPVLCAWGFTREEKQVPEEEKLAELLPLVDYRKIRLQGNTVTLPEKGMIDLGSVAKGYTGDMLADALRAAGVTSACLNLGGNVQTVGSKPDGSPWRIGVQDPASEDVLGVLELQDEVAITSGAYQRFFTDDAGNIYGHILNPETGYPAESGLAGVTVVGKSGVLCDGLSTALYVMGLERGIALWRESEDFDAVFICDDGSVYVTDGIARQFTLRQTERELTVIKR